MKVLSVTFSFLKGQFKRLDKLLLLLCITASSLSVYLLYTMVQNEINPDVISNRTWIMQLAAAFVGITLALLISLLDHKLISKICLFTFAPMSLILSLLLFTPLGVQTAGSTETNWLNLGFVQIQPSEFLTVAFIMTFSAHLHKVGDKMNQINHMLLLCLHAFVPIIIMVLQDNTGAPLIVLLVFLMMMFMAGISWKYIAAVVVSLPALGYVFWNFYAKDYHKLRIQVIFDEEIRQQEILGIFYQQGRSLVAMGSGGLTGQGLSKSGGGEYISIFAIHNDFMFAYIGMSLGLIGCILVLVLMLAICIKLLTVAGVAKDPLGKSICTGVFATIFFHTVINVGMVTAVTPVVGVPLPFISSGGSSTLSLYIAIGFALSVWANREKKYHLFYSED
ncbi:MAG: FtsW/RodA/SpoVE family cell cycle protein [Oscillospiraceae bacterium]|nr:FtsW/RodA/SpoVE family cell cycle protein [Oscillospiraceae bacterium]